MEAGDFLGLVHLQRKTSSQETREEAIEEDIQHGTLAYTPTHTLSQKER